MPDIPQAKQLLQAALRAAEDCRNVEWYGVGCVIADAEGKIVATGYTGELRDEDGKQRHAEDVAISKLAACDLPRSELTLYSTLEPCSVRASGKPPCVRRIIESGIRRVVFGAHEPYEPKLGIWCRGEEELKAAGLEAVQLHELEKECLRSIAARRKSG